MQPIGAGAVAQMGERCNRTAEASGSIPLSSTNQLKKMLYYKRLMEGLGKAFPRSFPHCLATDSGHGRT